MPQLDEDRARDGHHGCMAEAASGEGMAMMQSGLGPTGCRAGPALQVVMRVQAAARP